MARRLPVLLLVGLFVLVGHDMLMAANPHNPALSPAEHASAHDPADTGTDCGAAEGARPSSFETQGLPDDHAAPPGVVDETRIPHNIRAAWVIEPTHPPDVRRALLQVYLN